MYNYDAYVDRVVDGDTFYAVVDLGFHMSARLDFRLADIDTAEIYRPSCEAELVHGQEAKAFVENLILNKVVNITTKKTGKYGRWIATVHLGDKTLSEILRENDFAKRDSYV